MLKEQDERRKVLTKLPPKLRNFAVHLRYDGPAVRRIQSAAKALGLRCPAPLCLGDKDVVNCGFPDRKIAVRLYGAHRKANPYRNELWAKAGWRLYEWADTLILNLAPEELIEELKDLVRKQRSSK